MRFGVVPPDRRSYLAFVKERLLLDQSFSIERIGRSRREQPEPLNNLAGPVLSHLSESSRFKALHRFPSVSVPFTPRGDLFRCHRAHAGNLTFRREPVRPKCLFRVGRGAQADRKIPTNSRVQLPHGIPIWSERSQKARACRWEQDQAGALPFWAVC